MLRLAIQHISLNSVNELSERISKCMRENSKAYLMRHYVVYRTQTLLLQQLTVASGVGTEGGGGGGGGHPSYLVSIGHEIFKICTL